MTVIEAAPASTGASGSFYEANNDSLRALFVALGREHEWRDSAQGILPYTQAKWVGEEHGNSAEKDKFTDKQEAAAFTVLGEMGFRDEVLPPEGLYEQVIVIGGLMRVNRQRLQFVRSLIDEEIVAADKIVFWAGPRERDYRDDAQLKLMDIKGMAEQHSWVQSEIEKPSDQGRGFATETELARLGYLETFPSARLASVAGTTSLWGRHTVSRYAFKDNTHPEFVLMNCKAVERPNGKSRHTSVSCQQEWLTDVPPSPDAKILLVAGNPHTLRNDREARQVALRSGRADIEFATCGPAANPAASLQLYLGEVGRMLYMDARAATPASAWTASRSPDHA